MSDTTIPEAPAKPQPLSLKQLDTRITKLTELVEALAEQTKPAPAPTGVEGDLDELAKLKARIDELEEAANTVFVTRSELGEMIPPVDELLPCTLCSCTEFRDEHPSGNPELCMLCNHKLGEHAKKAKAA